MIKEKDIRLAELKVSLESLKVTIEEKEDDFLIQRDEIRLLVHCDQFIICKKIYRETYKQLLNKETKVKRYNYLRLTFNKKN